MLGKVPVMLLPVVAFSEPIMFPEKLPLASDISKLKVLLAFIGPLVKVKGTVMDWLEQRVAEAGSPVVIPGTINGPVISISSMPRAGSLPPVAWLFTKRHPKRN